MDPDPHSDPDPEGKKSVGMNKKKMQTWKILYTGILFVVFSDFLNCTGIYKKKIFFKINQI